jgi:hypothetical protein
MAFRLIFDLPLSARFPSQCCCNCGSQTALEVIATEVQRRISIGIASIDRRVMAPLPYCPNCKRSALRVPIGNANRLALAISLAISMAAVPVFLIGYATMRSPGEKPSIGFLVATFVQLCIVSIPLVLGWLALRRPRRGQTSWYQPVRLIEFRTSRTLEGKPWFVLGFTNATYGQLFTAENAEAIATKHLRVREL